MHQLWCAGMCGFSGVNVCECVGVRVDAMAAIHHGARDVITFVLAVFDFLINAREKMHRILCQVRLIGFYRPIAYVFSPSHSPLSPGFGGGVSERRGSFFCQTSVPQHQPNRKS